MYHPAVIREKIVTGNGTKFFVETWDDNAFTVDAAESVAEDDIAEGQVVLLDYYPDPEYDLPTPKQVVSAVLEEEQGQRIWERYRELFEESQQPQTVMTQMGANPFDGGYIG